MNSTTIAAEFSTVNPATGGLLKTFTYHSSSQVEDLLGELQSSFQKWRNTSWDQRKLFFQQLQRLLIAQKDSLANQMSLEMGKPLADARAEIEKSALSVQYYAERGAQFLQPEKVSENGFAAKVEMSPIGLVWAIMPWNFPLWQFVRCAIPAFLLGNVVLLKHSDITAGSAELIVNLFNQAALDSGLPFPLCKNLRLPHTQTESVMADPRIKAVSFTGSVRGGSQVAALAGKYLKKSVMELGGSDAYLILAGADINSAAKICAQSRLQNAGQSCVAAKRFFVHENLYNDFLQQMKQHFSQIKIGDPFKAETQMGPLAHQRFAQQLHLDLKAHAERIYYQAQDFKSENKTAYFPPTILEMPTSDHSWDQEFFGPIACVWKFNEVSEAVHQANNSIFGLGSGVFSQDLSAARKTAQLLEAGMVAINDMIKSDVRIPFGGVKSSGFGRELSHYGVMEFANLKTYMGQVEV